jgi:uncharacterized protein (DUF1501 family)
MRSSGALAAYCGVSPLQALADAWAAENPAPVIKGRTLVVIFLRGGTDGLNLIVPYKDPHYRKLRKDLYIPAPGQPEGAIDLDGFFALHPRMRSIAPLLKTGQAVAAHAIGYDKNSRSHFTEQDVWETGIIGNTVSSDGWLNRHLLTSTGVGPIRAISIGDSLPRILRGDGQAFAIRGLSDLTASGSPDGEDAVFAALEHAYRVTPESNLPAARELLLDSGQLTLDAMRKLRDVVKREYRPNVDYPQSELGRKLKEIARLIKANVGLEVAEVDFGGWDTHSNQGAGAGGLFGNLAQGLADAVSAFQKDLSDRMGDVLVLTLSDFGRTAKENGTRGTDHGWANCMLLFGGSTNKGNPGKVFAKWPGLAPDQLHDSRDLRHTIDFRDVLAEVVAVHLGNKNLSKILPGHEFKKIGVVA